MTILKVTLSRAHKIAERLKDLMKTTLSEAEALASPARFTGKPSVSEVVELNSRASEAQRLAETATVYAGAWGNVRKAISAENHIRGIDAMLADLEAVNKLTSTYQKLVDAAKDEGCLPSEVADYVPPTSPYGGALLVNALRAPEVRKQFADRLNLLRQSAIQLSDNIASSNAAQFQLELPDDVAAAVTGGAPV